MTKKNYDRILTLKVTNNFFTHSKTQEEETQSPSIAKDTEKHTQKKNIT